LVGKWPDESTAQMEHANRDPLAQERHTERCAIAAFLLSFDQSVFRINSHLPALRKLVAFEEVGDMNSPCFEHRTAGDPVAGEWLSLPEGSAERTGVRTRDHHIPVAEKDCCVRRLTETRSSPDNRVQDRLDVGRRATDRSKDSGRARLLL